MVDSSPAGRRYAVFISYRHADNKEMGRKWANWLHEALESYEVPPDLVGSTSLRGDQVPPSLYPVFRDEEELPADADLSANIQRALEHSGLLVVICSPRAVKRNLKPGERDFVAGEIRYFKELGKSDRILALMIDGEPNASDDPAKRAAFRAEDECFPEPLRFGVASEENPTRIDWSARTEPIAADARPGGRAEQGWTTAAAYEEHLRRQGGHSEAETKEAVRDYAVRLEQAKLKIIAGALGLSLGVLTKRDKAAQIARAKHRARILRRWLVVVGVLTVAAFVSGAVAWRKQREASKNEAEARAALAAETLALARSHYAKAVELIEADRVSEAGAYVAMAHRLLPEDPVCWSMMFSLLTQPPPLLPVGRPMKASGALDARPMLSHDGSHLILQTGFSVHLFDTRTGEVRYSAGGPQGYWGGCFALEGTGSLVTSQDGLGFDFYPTVPGLSEPQPFFRGAGEKANNMPLLGNRLRLGRGMNSFIMASGGLAAEGIGIMSGPDSLPPSLPVVVVARDSGLPQVLDVGSAVQEFVVTSPRADLIALGSRKGAVSVWDYATSRKLIADEFDGRVTAMAFTHDGSRVLASSWDNHVRGYVPSKGRIFDVDRREDVNDLSLAADDTALLAGDDSGVQLLNPATGGEMSPQVSIPSGANAVALDPTGRRAVVGAQDGALWTVDFTGSNWQRRKITILQDKPDFVALEPDGETALTVTRNGLAQRWPVRGWDAAIQQVIPVRGEVESVQFSPDGRSLLAVATHEQLTAVYLINLSDPEPATAMGFLPLQRKAVSTAFLKDGTGVVCCASGEVFRAKAKGWELTLTPVPTGIEAGSVMMSGGVLADDTQTLFLPRVAIKDMMTALQGLSDDQMFTHDIRKLMGEAIKKIAADIRMIPLAEEKPAVKVLNARAATLAANRAGTLVVGVDSSGGMTVVRQENGEWKAVPVEPPASPVRDGQDGASTFGFELALSKRGDIAVFGTMDHRFQVFRIGDKVRRIFEIHHGKAINEVAVSADGSHVAFGDRDGTVRLIETSSGKDVASGMRHGGDYIRTVAFSADGQWLLSAAEDDKVRLWHTRTGRLASVPVDAESDVNQAVFSPDEKTVAMAVDDGEIRRAGIGIHSPRPPSWVPGLLESLSGFRIGSKGAREPIPVEHHHEWRHKLREHADGSWWGRVAAGLIERDRPLMPQIGRRVSAELAAGAANAMIADRNVSWAAFGATRAREFKRDISLDPELERLAVLNENKPGESVKLVLSDRKPGEERRTASGITLCWCPAGRFLAGSPFTEPGRGEHESPHHVILPEGFWMARTEITQAQWRKVMGREPVEHAKDRLREKTIFHPDSNDPNKTTTLLSAHSLNQPEDIDGWTGFFRGEMPMSFVTWDDAAAFCRQLTTLEQKAGVLPEGYAYRLPTLAEWEFACRAGSATATYAGPIEIVGRCNAPVLNDIAWYSGNASVDFAGTGWSSKDWPERAFSGDWAGPHDVARLKPNPWGLHDMLGNVSEWCIDGSTGGDFIRHVYFSLRLKGGNRRVCAGGSWRDHSNAVRAASHHTEVEDWCDHTTGFRVVLARISPDDPPASPEPQVFHYQYRYQPEPGPRIWEPREGGVWTETYPSGKQDRFIVLKQTEVFGRPGLLFRRQEEVNGIWTNSTSFEVFVQLPREGEATGDKPKSPGIYFRTMGPSGWRQWSRLGGIIPGKP